MRSINYFFLLLPWLCLLSCKSDEQTAPPNLIDPIIKTGDFFPNSNWNDPHAIEADGKFIMYASASQNFDENIKIYRLESADGIAWTQNPSNAVFERSTNLTAWDSKSTETPAVVYYDGKYHLFYTGYKTMFTDVNDYKIGHATSTDGITWVRDNSFLLAPTAPSSDPNLDFNQFVVAEPGPIVFNNKLYLYFAAIGANAALNNVVVVIGLTIYDGASWTNPIAVLEPDQNIYPRDNYYGYSTPNAMVKDGKMHLYFDVVQADPWKQIKIHHAESNDGITGWNTDPSSILNKEDYPWAENEVNGPSALYHNQKVYLFFAGNKGLDLGIGLKIIE